MTILAQLSFRVSKQAGQPGLGPDGQYNTGGGIGTGGGSGYTPEGGGFFPPNVASPYFVPTPVYGPQGPATVSGPGVIVVSKLPQGKIMQVDHPPTAIPGAAFNLITRFTHKHTGTGVYTIRVKFPQIAIDSTSPPTTISQNGVGVIISTVTVPGESATSPIPSILTGTIELIRTQPAGTSNGTTVEAMQVMDDSRVVTMNKIGTVPLPTPVPIPIPPGTPGGLCVTQCRPLAFNGIPGDHGACLDKCTDPLSKYCVDRCAWRRANGEVDHVQCLDSCVRSSPFPQPGPTPDPTPTPPPTPGPATLAVTLASETAEHANLDLNGGGFYPNETVILSYFISGRTTTQFIFMSELTAGTGGTFTKPVSVKKIAPLAPTVIRFRAWGKQSGRHIETPFTANI